MHADILKKMSKSKKSQIQMGETIAVVFVFFILVIVGLIFYVKVQKGQLETEKEELSQLRSVAIAQRIMFLPELQCSEDNIVSDNCIDMLKLDTAQKVMRDNQLYYYDLLEFTDISILEIYPGNSTWKLYSRRIEDFSSKYITNIPISLYDPAIRQNRFGILTVETMSK